VKETQMSATPTPNADRSVVRAMQWLIYVAIAGSLLAGAAIVVIGFASILNGIWELRHAEAVDVELVRSFSVEVVEVADAFLLGVVMFIIAIGLFQLFINPQLEVPKWLRVSSLSDLKENLLAVTIVLLGISFLGRVVEWEGDKNIIYYGVAIAAVLIPLVAMFALLSRVNTLEARKAAAESQLPEAARVPSGPEV
jgi:uncharacterized membrane protein YqhA